MVATAAPEFNTRGNRFKPLAYADLAPDQKAFADKELAAGRNPSTGPFNIYLRSPQYAELSQPLANGRHAWLHVAEGEIVLNGKTLAGGDAAAVDGEEKLNLSANKPSQVLLFDLN